MVGDKSEGFGWRGDSDWVGGVALRVRYFVFEGGL